MAELVNLKECIVSGKLEDAKTIVNEAIAAGVEAQDIINNYLIKGMEEIGQRFEKGKRLYQICYWRTCHERVS